MNTLHSRPTLPSPRPVEHVARRLRLASSQQAETLIDAVYAALATQIREPERALLAERLPPRLADAVHHTRPTATLGLDELFTELAERHSVSESLASSLVEASCEALLCQLPPQVREQLTRQLSSPWAELLEVLHLRGCGPVQRPLDRELVPRAARRSRAAVRAPRPRQPQVFDHRR